VIERKRFCQEIISVLVENVWQISYQSEFNECCWLINDHVVVRTLDDDFFVVVSVKSQLRWDPQTDKNQLQMIRK